MKFKYRALIGFTLVAFLVVTIQIAMWFIESYKFQLFVKRDQSTWIGIAGKAQAENWTCQQELEKLKQARDKANSDILE